MNKLHTTVSRRDFMKGIGLVGAGLGAAAATAPVFHDLDEVMPQSNVDPQYRPWWIKQRDFEDPTTEIDWQLSHRADRTKPFQNAAGYTSSRFSGTTSLEPTAALLAKLDALPTPVSPQIRDALATWPMAQWDFVKKKFPEWEGNTVRDYAMEAASASLAFYNFHAYGGYRNYNAATHKSSSFTGLETANTPEGLGFAKWQGTPEENLKMVRGAMRTFGCEEVAVVEVTTNTIKMVNAKNTSGKPINFKSVDKATDVGSEYVIPNKCKYMIIYTNLQPTYLTQRCPAQVGLSANKNSYTRMPVQRVQLQEFIRGLGYQGLQVDGLTQSCTWSVLGGIGEHGREAMNVVSPFYGANYRGIQRMLTDLPLAPTKPIDAGVAKFCLTCKKCADNCPYSAFSTGDPEWEHWLEEERTADNVIDGHVYKGWRLSNYRCPRCQACQGVCVFTKIPDSGIHNIVRAMSSTTSIFNGFFRQMDDFFGYGTKEPESWWDMKSQPVWGIEPRYWTSI